MHSPSVENSPEADSTTEEPKSIDHLSCFRPFQSSFKSNLSKNHSTECVADHTSDEIHTKENIRENAGESNALLGKFNANPWFGRKFQCHTETRNQTSYFFGHSSYGLENSGEVIRNPTSSTNGLSQIQMNPMLFYPDLLVPAAPNLRQYSQIAGCRRYCDLDGHRSALNYRNFGEPTVKNVAVPSLQTGYPRGNNSAIKAYHVPHPSKALPATRNSCQDIQKTGHNRPMMCNFCKNNKEVPDIYLNHYLYDPKTRKLTCPVLRKHVCEICGETGDRAHTLQYCPINRQRGLQAKVPVLLKTRTITNSTGKIRRN